MLFFKNMIWVLLIGTLAASSIGVDAGLGDMLKAGNNKLKEMAAKNIDRKFNPQQESFAEISQLAAKHLRR